MAWPTMEVPIAVIAVLVSVVLSVPANFATKVAQERWLRQKKERDEQVRWYDELAEIAGRISGSTDLYKQSLVSHDTLIPEEDYIEKQLEVVFAKERKNWEDKLDEEILNELENIVTSAESVAQERSNYQQSAIQKIEKINQRKMDDMAALHDELLRHVAGQSISGDEQLEKPLENLLVQTYLQSIFPEITDSNHQEILEDCENVKEVCETRIEQLS